MFRSEQRRETEQPVNASYIPEVKRDNVSYNDMQHDNQAKMNYQEYLVDLSKKQNNFLEKQDEKPAIKFKDLDKISQQSEDEDDEKKF